MNPTVPPPIPGRQRAWVTYLAAFGLTVPSLALLIFSTTIHLPKLEKIWQEAGLDASKAHLLLEGCRFVPNNIHFIGMGVVLLLILVEHFWPSWPRCRRFVVLGAVFVFQVLTMLELTVVTTAALLAAPVAIVKAKSNQ